MHFVQWISLSLFKNLSNPTVLYISFLPSVCPFLLLFSFSFASIRTQQLVYVRRGSGPCNYRLALGVKVFGNVHAGFCIVFALFGFPSFLPSFLPSFRPLCGISPSIPRLMVIYHDPCIIESMSSCPWSPVLLPTTARINVFVPIKPSPTAHNSKNQCLCAHNAQSYCP